MLNLLHHRKTAEEELKRDKKEWKGERGKREERQIAHISRKIGKLCESVNKFTCSI